MPDEDEQPPVPAVTRAREAAEAGQITRAGAWALIGIAEELRAIRQEQHRQARSRSSRG